MYTRPVNPTGISSYAAHTRRNPPSQEAGVDYYCPTGTPLKAAGNGRIFACAGGVVPATGRYITLDLDDGRRVRYLHLKDWACKPGDRVSKGQIIGYTGASGYGSELFGESSRNAAFWANTGGDHVHTTLWPTHAYSFGTNAGTLDFEKYVDGALAGGESTPFEEDDMFTDADRNLLKDVQNKLSIPDADYGRPEVIQQRVDGLGEAVARIAAGQIIWPGSEAAPFYAFPALANTIREDDGNPPAVVEVDEVALAQALAPLLPAHMGSLSDADVQRLAQAAGDELARRLAG